MDIDFNAKKAKELTKTIKETNRILKSNKKLIADIDKCIDDLLEGKKYNDQIVINYAYDKMEKLLVDSLQQFNAINAIIEKLND